MPTNVRLDDDQLRRLDKIAAALEKKVVGVKVSRADVIRAAIERGMQSFEAGLVLPSSDAA